MSFAMINPVDEGLLMVVILFVVSGFLGDSIWKYHIESLNMSSAQVALWSFIALTLIFALTTSYKIIKHSSVGFFFKTNIELVFFSLFTVSFFAFF